MENKEIIELMVPEGCLDEYIARINISEGYFARAFENDDTKTYKGVSAIVIEGISYDKILKFIETFPPLLEIVVIENIHEQYLYTAQLKRHGVHFMARQKFLERFDDTEEVSVDTASNKTIKVEKKEGRFNLLSRFNREKKATQRVKNSISTLLTSSKTSVQKVELRTTEKEKMIPVIKRHEKEVKKAISKGTYILSGSAFTTFLMTEYLALKAPITVVDITGKLNNFYGCREKEKVKELLLGKDDPLIIHGNIIFYGDSDMCLSVEELLLIRERLHQETMIVVFYMPQDQISIALPIADKIFYCMDESKIITRAGEMKIENSSKVKIVVSQRMHILTRHAVKERLAVEDLVEVLELSALDSRDMTSIYKSVDKREMVKKSVIEKYFETFAEQI